MVATALELSSRSTYQEKIWAVAGCCAGAICANTCKVVVWPTAICELSNAAVTMTGCATATRLENAASITAPLISKPRIVRLIEKRAGKRMAVIENVKDFATSNQ